MNVICSVILAIHVVVFHGIREDSDSLFAFYLSSPFQHDSSNQLFSNDIPPLLPLASIITFIPLLLVYGELLMPFVVGINNELLFLVRKLLQCHSCFVLDNSFVVCQLTLQCDTQVLCQYCFPAVLLFANFVLHAFTHYIPFVLPVIRKQVTSLRCSYLQFLLHSLVPLFCASVEAGRFCPFLQLHCGHLREIF